MYKLERGTEYSQYNAEKYVQAKKEMETVINAYNKKQQFVDFTEALRKEELTFAEKEEIKQKFKIYIRNKNAPF